MESLNNGLKYPVDDVIITGEEHENMLRKENDKINQMLQSDTDRIRAADIKIPNAIQIFLGPGKGMLLIVVNPKYQKNPYILHEIYKDGKFIFSDDFPARNLEFLLTGKPREKLESQIQDILANRETHSYSKMKEAEREACAGFIDKIEDIPGEDQPDIER